MCGNIPSSHTNLKSTSFFNISAPFGLDLQGDPGVQGVKGDGGPKGEPVSSRHLQNTLRIGGLGACALTDRNFTSLLPASG